MPLKDWVQHVTGEFKIYVQRRTLFGKITSFSVVLIHHDICISRYDTAHGHPHRDILGARAGWIGRERLDHPNRNDAFHYAIRDYEQNYESYLEFFLEN
jgi:hypothetical protein